MGTMAQAMRAGRPTVIVPFAHDQFDNAARTNRLGISETLAREQATAVPLAQTLRKLLDDHGYRERAAALGARLSVEDGADVAAERLEAFARPRAG
jgi:UDP:flavonoid glycosyltransferase YjiC (YdhE family)